MSETDDVAREVVGTCNAAIVKLPKDTALICLVLNCIPFLAGIGTMVSACTTSDFNCMALIFGLCQWFLQFILIGYIWSIVHGIWLFDQAEGGSSLTDDADS